MSIVLIVEDEIAITRFLRAALEGDGLRVHDAGTLQRGLIEAATRKPDLVILDLGLPDGDGIDFIREVRQWSQMPILVLSARTEETDKIAALDAGADDYLVKPFSTDELLARLRALARRPLDAPPVPMLQAGELRLDPRSRRAFWRQGDLELTPKEYALLELLMRQPQQVFSRGQIFSQLYDSASEVSDKAVEVIMSTLRTKLLKAGTGEQIKTRRGFGYVFE